MNAITAYKNPALTSARPQMIKNLQLTGLAERGKIKIGMKGREIESRSGNKFQPPQKLDHFLITGLERDRDGNFVRDDRMMAAIAEETGQEAKRLLKLPIRLLFDDVALNFQSSYAAFDGRKLWCRGDGQEATRGGETVKCTCQNLEPAYDGKQKCKPNGRLQVMIDGAQSVGGVWMFRTTSWNTITGLYSSMAFIQSATGGKLAGIPLNLTIGPKQVTAPDGKQMTAHIVGIEFAGTMEALRAKSFAAMLEEEKHSARIEMVHDQAMKLISAPIISDEDEEEIADEFFPPSRDDQAVMSETKSRRDLAAELAAQSEPVVEDDHEIVEHIGEPVEKVMPPEEIEFFTPHTETTASMPLAAAIAKVEKLGNAYLTEGDVAALEWLRDKNPELMRWSPTNLAMIDAALKELVDA